MHSPILTPEKPRTADGTETGRQRLDRPEWTQAPPPGTQAIWLFGPTAGGKSALAMSIAARLDAVIINADASQLYADLRILTARPGAAEEAVISHALYGVLPASARASAGVWLNLVAPAIRAAQAAGKLPLLVGGTGMYLQALLEGIAPVPDIPPAIRAALAEDLAAQGLPALRAELARADPALAARLAPGDTQRNLRGLEVLRATGLPLSAWHAHPRFHPLAGMRWHGLALLPPRAALYRRIDQRAEAMLDRGAEAEVRALLAAGHPRTAPILKTIGVPELRAWIEGRATRAEALAKLQQHSRNYAKRQLTWARGQLGLSL